MNILVLGSAGMLGHMLTICFRERGHNVTDAAYPKKAFDESIVLDVRDTEAVQELMRRGYERVINCVALLIGDSQKQPTSAVWINSYFPNYLAALAENTATQVIHISTDGVFGEAAPCDETGAHLNRSFYARTKSMGEVEGPNIMTLRSSYFGPDMSPLGQGLLNWFFTQKGQVSGYRNAVFSGITSLELAFFMENLALDASGIMNLCAAHPIDKYSLLRKTKECFRFDDIEIVADDTITSDTSVTTRRKDVPYLSKDYDAMLSELRVFMDKHRGLYPHYRCLNDLTERI